MHIAIGAIGIGVILMVAFLVLAQVGSLMPSVEEMGNDTNITTSMSNSQNIIIAGLGLLGVGVIIMAAFGLINVWK